MTHQEFCFSWMKHTTNSGDDATHHSIDHGPLENEKSLGEILSECYKSYLYEEDEEVGLQQRRREMHRSRPSRLLYLETVATAGDQELTQKAEPRG